MRRFRLIRSTFGLLLGSSIASCGSDGPTEPAGPPEAPPGVQVTAAPAEGSLSVSWTPVSGATSYTVYMASAAGVTKANYTTHPDGRTIANASTPTVVSGLEGKTYYVVVTASNAEGESAESAEASGAPNVPLSPTGNTTLTATSYRFTRVNIREGVTVTLSGPVAITVVEDATIEGTLRANCHAVELRVAGDVVIEGRVTNACTILPAGGGPDLKILADGSLVVGVDPSLNDALVSDGAIRLTDTATENVSFSPLFEPSGSNSPPAAAPPAGQAAGVGVTIERPIRAGKGLKLTNEGNIAVGADLLGLDGMGVPARSQSPACDNTSTPGSNGGPVYVASRSGTLTIADDVTISGGDGGSGGDCTARPLAASATAVGGRGGDGGGIYFGGQVISFGNDVLLLRGSGGPGGDAVAEGGTGPAPCGDGFTGTATGGAGGARGGIGYVVRTPGEVVGLPLERGGDGGVGGAATAEGGNGAGCGTTAGDGGDGGLATAFGGSGGIGPSGNIWPRGPISHRSGAGGAARSTGGDGGNGADLCTAKEPGGDGGWGGDATATGGPNGGAAVGGTGSLGRGDSFGGDGGDGGDGLGGGEARDGGTAESTGDPTTEQDGTGGNDGVFCEDLPTWDLYFGDIPNGNIAPGTDVVIPVFDEAHATQMGTVPGRFKTPFESGVAGIQYVRLNEFILFGRGKAFFDLGNVVPGFPVVTVEAFVDLVCTAQNCSQIVGYYDGDEVGRVGNEAVVGPENQQQLLRLPPPPPNVPYYDAFEVEVIDGGFWVNNWNVSIVDP